MFVGIANSARDYAWGAVDAISTLLGAEPSGRPEAELWLGAHPGSPSRIVDADAAGGAADLAAWIAADPRTALGDGRDGLPFLLKVLAAGAPLSLQVHPTTEQAVAGFAREEAAGVPVDAAHRNYRDDRHKPELILAVSPTFEALAGFRPLHETKLLVEEFRAVASARRDQGPLAALDELRDRLDADAEPVTVLRELVGWILAGGDGVDAARDAVVAYSLRAPAVSSYTKVHATIADLADRYPGDPGVLTALLLNRVTLQEGQAIFAGAGVVHAYLSGVGIEIMASSDNVLRGGLTPKHIDVDELLAVADFTPAAVPTERPVEVADGVTVFRPAVEEFELFRVAVGEGGAAHGYRLRGPDEAVVPISGPAIILVTDGAARVKGANSAVDVLRGGAAYVTPDEAELRFTGDAILYIATTSQR